MSTLAYFRARPDYALGRAFLLAFAVHAVLVAFMFIGVRMQNRPGDTVTVELWEAPPPPPPPVVEAPKPPPPKIEPPKPEPEPEVKKPEIVEKAPPPKPKPKPKPEAKAPPRDDLEKLLMREQVAMEQQKLNEERRQIDEARRKAESEKTARQLAAKASSRALAQWTDKIRAKIRGNIIMPQDISGNPEAIFDVALLPTGEILTVSKRKSSGHAAYDEAVERAIHKSSPLPQPDQPGLFQRNLELRFRPQDQ
ncbi:MAG: TonB C-terminal domain-containing protein [Burkholderiales bacterium]